MGKIGIIIQREFYQRVRKKSFIITTILTPLLLVGVMGAAIGIQLISVSDVRHIAVSDATGLIAPNLESTESVVFEPTTASFEQIKQQKSDGQHEDLYGVLVIGADIFENPKNVALYTYGTSTLDLETAVSRQINEIIENEKLKGYNIENLSEILSQVKTDVSLRSYRIEESGIEKESSSGLAMASAYIFGFLIYMFIFIYGGMVLQGVVEEKSSRVMEVMVSSVRPFQLMMGKILGIALVAITQFFIWVLFIAIAGTVLMSLISPETATAVADSSMTDMAASGGMDPESFATLSNATDPMFLLRVIGGFLVFFIGGYLLYAAMFAAIGSAVDNVADTQQLQIPVTVPMILALIVMLNVMREPNSAMAFWFSIIPFTSPVVMLARLPYGVPAWELVTSIALLYGTFVLMVMLAGKIYRVGIFMYGKKPTFKELFKWARYKY